MVSFPTIFLCSHHDQEILKACCQCGIRCDDICKKGGYKGINMCETLQVSCRLTDDCGSVDITAAFWLVVSASYCDEVHVLPSQMKDT